MTKVPLVCIIDDDNIYRYTTQKFIQLLKLADDVMTCGNGEEALDFFSAHVDNNSKLPDVVLLDVNMPVMDGWEFIEEYAKIYPDITKKIKVYMVSSSIDERDKARALKKREITDYIIKPISEQQLIALLRKPSK